MTATAPALRPNSPQLRLHVADKVAHLANEPTAARNRPEAEVRIERRGSIVERVDDDEAGRHELGCGHNTLSCVWEEKTSEASAVQGAVQREPGDQHSRDPMGEPRASERRKASRSSTFTRHAR